MPYITPLRGLVYSSHDQLQLAAKQLDLFYVRLFVVQYGLDDHVLVSSFTVSSRT